MKIMIGTGDDWNETEVTEEVQKKIDSGELVPCKWCDENGGYDDGLPTYHPARPESEQEEQ